MRLFLASFNLWLKFVLVVAITVFVLVERPQDWVANYFKDDTNILVPTHSHETIPNIKSNKENLVIHYNNAWPKPYRHYREGVDNFVDSYVDLINDYPHHIETYDDMMLLNKAMVRTKQLERTYHRADIETLGYAPSFNKYYPKALEILIEGYETKYEEHGYQGTLVLSIDTMAKIYDN